MSEFQWGLFTGPTIDSTYPQSYLCPVTAQKLLLENTFLGMKGADSYNYIQKISLILEYLWFFYVPELHYLISLCFWHSPYNCVNVWCKLYFCWSDNLQYPFFYSGDIFVCLELRQILIWFIYLFSCFIENIYFCVLCVGFSHKVALTLQMFTVKNKPKHITLELQSSDGLFWRNSTFSFNENTGHLSHLSQVLSDAEKILRSCRLSLQ